MLVHYRGQAQGICQGTNSQEEAATKLYEVYVNVEESKTIVVKTTTQPTTQNNLM